MIYLFWILFCKIVADKINKNDNDIVNTCAEYVLMNFKIDKSVALL
jgi:hypothetical protein